jgi:hypothetical protein
MTESAPVVGEPNVGAPPSAGPRFSYPVSDPSTTATRSSHPKAACGPAAATPRAPGLGVARATEAGRYYSTALLVDAQQARSTVEADRRQMLQHRVNIRGARMQRAANRCTDPDDTLRLIPALQSLLHQLLHRTSLGPRPTPRRPLPDNTASRSRLGELTRTPREQVPATWLWRNCLSSVPASQLSHETSGTTETTVTAQTTDQRGTQARERRERILAVFTPNRPTSAWVSAAAASR